MVALTETPRETTPVKPKAKTPGTQTETLPVTPRGKTPVDPKATTPGTQMENFPYDFTVDTC